MTSLHICLFWDILQFAIQTKKIRALTPFYICLFLCPSVCNPEKWTYDLSLLLSILVFFTSSILPSWQINFWSLYVSKFVFLPSSSLPSWLFSPDISSTNFMLCLFFSYLPASFFFSYNLYITSYIISIISYISYRLVQRVGHNFEAQWVGF